jgi:predicted nucleotidyltransferase
MTDDATQVAPALTSVDAVPLRIAEAARCLHAAEPEAAIVLFGSQARGEARAGSDVDFLVVLRGTPVSTRAESTG